VILFKYYLYLLMVAGMHSYTIRMDHPAFINEWDRPAGICTGCLVYFWVKEHILDIITETLQETDDPMKVRISLIQKFYKKVDQHQIDWIHLLDIIVEKIWENQMNIKFYILHRACNIEIEVRADSVTLLTFAAKAVIKEMNETEKVEQLEIPSTLKNEVTKMMEESK